MARTVRMNHVGWAMTRDFRFFLSLPSKHKNLGSIIDIYIRKGFIYIYNSPTVCQSSGNTSSASWFQASYCAEWLRSCRWSGNLQPRASPGCSPHTWGSVDEWALFDFFYFILMVCFYIWNHNDNYLKKMNCQTHRKRFSMM